MCMAALRRIEHGGGVTVLMRQQPKVGLHHWGRCYTYRQHGNGYQSGLRAADEVGGGELVRAAMVGALTTAARSHAVMAVAIK